MSLKSSVLFILKAITLDLSSLQGYKSPASIDSTSKKFAYFKQIFTYFSLLFILRTTLLIEQFQHPKGEFFPWIMLVMHVSEEIAIFPKHEFREDHNSRFQGKDRKQGPWDLQQSLSLRSGSFRLRFS